MTLDFNATTFYTQANWSRRLESASSIADRFERYLEMLEQVDPLLSGMFVRVDATGTPFAIARPNLEKLVQKTAERNGKRQIEPRAGFTVAALTRRKENNFEFRGFVGVDYPSPAPNTTIFSSRSGAWPDLSLMTYSLFRGAMLATIECWEPLHCVTQPSTLHPYIARGNWFHATWMTYVHPQLVHRVTPPDIPVVEATPDGGLLLAATTETFNVNNLTHFAAARRIRDATSHLDDVMPRLT